MFVAMNHFNVNADRCADFERAWRERESYLDGVDGFESVHLLAGPTEAGSRSTQPVDVAGQRSRST